MKSRNVLAFGLVALVGCGGDDSNAGGGNGGGIDGGGPVPGACPALSKPRTGGTTHDASQMRDFETDQVWKAADSPHVVINGYRQRNGTLIIEPCAYVRLQGHTGIDVMRTGTIDATGTATEPIVFESDDDGEGFRGIAQSFEAGNGETPDETGGRVKLSYVTFNGGGDTGTFGVIGVLDGTGRDTQAQGKPFDANWEVHHVTINGSVGYGVQLKTGAAFAPGSEDLTIKDAAKGPMVIGFRSMGTVPTGTYANNPGAQILVDYDVTSLDKDVTIKPVDVAYRMGEGPSQDMGVGPLAGGATATLTVEAGVKLIFGPRTTLAIKPSGILKVMGTGAKPVVFTSAAATPSPGDWGGISFDNPVHDGSSIDHAEVSYAGERDTAGGAVCDRANRTSVAGYGAINFAGKPATAFVTNTTIQNSASDGFTRGWGAGGLLDLTPTNTLTGIAGCKQSYPYPDAGTCPDPVPCEPAP